jgi:hypothetical protein
LRDAVTAAFNTKQIVDATAVTVTKKENGRRNSNIHSNRSYSKHESGVEYNMQLKNPIYNGAQEVFR